MRLRLLRSPPSSVPGHARVPVALSAASMAIAVSFAVVSSHRLFLAAVLLQMWTHAVITFDHQSIESHVITTRLPWFYRVSEDAIAQLADEKAQRLEATNTVETLTARVAAADVTRAAASATALELQSTLAEQQRTAAALREEAGGLKAAMDAGRQQAFRR